MTKQQKLKRERYIVPLDDKVDIDQMRMIHNALKQYITYVQGPPGTGKMQSILNVIVSSFFNEQTALIAASNNHPLDSIFHKLTTLAYQTDRKTYPIPFPILRLGNRDVLLESLKRIKTLHETYKDFDVRPFSLDRIKKEKLSRTKDLNEKIATYEQRTELKERLKVLDATLERLKGTMRSMILEAEKDKLESALKVLPAYSGEDILEEVGVRDADFMTWLNYMSIERIKRLEKPRYAELFEIIETEDENERVRAFRHYLKDPKTFRHLQEVFPFIASTLHSTVRLGPAATQFDLTVIDEAGQATIAHALPAILRAERLLLVGDPNQLEPVVSLEPYISETLKRHYSVRKPYDYKENSLLKLMMQVDEISKYILLRHHYRSHKDIIAFSNRKHYDNALIIETQKAHDDALSFVDVKNDENPYQRHSCPKEADVIKQILRTHEGRSIGIITPFRQQKKTIESRLQDVEGADVNVGTIHSFQGDEKDVVMLSLSISPDTRSYTFEWLKNNRELINVAATRAKDYLILIGDYDALQEKSREPCDLREFVDYVKRRKESEVTAGADEHIKRRIHGVKPSRTPFEEAFLKTLEHLFTVQRQYTVKQGVTPSNIFKKMSGDDLSYFHASQFDFVVFDAHTHNPILIVELDGVEHRTSEQVKRRDEKKEKLCKKRGIILHRVPNEHARRYHLIRDDLIRVLQA